MKIKSFFITLLTVALLFSFIACAGTPNSDDSGSDDGNSDTPFEPDLTALRTQMIADFKADDNVSFEKDVLLDLYGIAESDVAESACYMTLDGVFPQEIVMIKATDEDAADRIISALDTRIADVKIQSESYDPENYALAQKCKVESRGLYVTMFLSPHFSEMSEMFYGTK